MQKSTSFILPMMGFRNPLLVSSIVNTYLGNVEYEGSEEWGNYFYIEFQLDSLNEFISSELRSHVNYKYEYDTINSTVMFIFNLGDRIKDTVIKPFLEGKYSLIDRDYVNRCFPKSNNLGSLSTNWRILMKDDWDRPLNIMSLRDYWYHRIGIELPEDAEVWSRPLKQDEIYGYKENLLIEGLFDIEL